MDPDAECLRDPQIDIWQIDVARQFWSLRQYVTYGNRWILPGSIAGAAIFAFMGLVSAGLPYTPSYTDGGLIIMLIGWAIWAGLIHRGRSIEARRAGWDPREVRQCRRQFPSY